MVFEVDLEYCVPENEQTFVLFIFAHLRRYNNSSKNGQKRRVTKLCGGYEQKVNAIRDVTLVKYSVHDSK